MQFKHVAEAKQQADILRDQTERSFNAIVSRADLLAADVRVGEKGKNMQDQIDGLASDLRKVTAELRRGEGGGALGASSSPSSSASGAANGRGSAVEQKTLVTGFRF